MHINTGTGNNADLVIVKDGDKTLGMVQLDPYGSGLWTCWTKNWLVSGGWEFDSSCGDRATALARFGYTETETN